MSSTSRQPIRRQPVTRQPVTRQPVVRTDKTDGVWRPIPNRTNSASNARRAEAANNEQKRQNDLQALSFNPLESLDREQSYANAGDTVPIVFGSEKDGFGGVWVSPPLAMATSIDFQRRFVYVISAGRALGRMSRASALIGKRSLSEVSYDPPDVQLTHSTSGDECPLAFAGISCNSDKFNFAIESVGIGIGSSSSFRVIDEYASKVTIRARPRVEGTTTVDAYQFNLQVNRYTKNGAGGPRTVVGTMTTSASSTTSVSITDVPPSDAYIYEVVNTGVAASNTFVPNSIILEVEQENTWPANRADRNSNFKDITFLVLTGNAYDLTQRYSDPQALKQLHVFCRDGISVYKWRFIAGGAMQATFDSSDKFADLVYHYANTSGLYAWTDVGSPVSTEDVAIAARFHDKYGMAFNGIVSSGTNFLSWAQQVAPLFLLGFYVGATELRLVPLLPLNGDGSINTGALTPQDAFDDADTGEDSIQNGILVGSYNKSYNNAQQRRPFKAVVSWRQQTDRNLETVRTTTVRYEDYSDDVPEEAFDLSSFASSESHATLFAKYILATRRYSSHTITFSTPRNTFGTLLNNRLYTLISVTLNRVNSLGDNVRQKDFYLVTNITLRPTGLVDIEAEHFPLDASDQSIISNSVITGAFRIET